MKRVGSRWATLGLLALMLAAACSSGGTRESATGGATGSPEPADFTIEEHLVQGATAWPSYRSFAEVRSPSGQTWSVELKDGPCTIVRHPAGCRVGALQATPGDGIFTFSVFHGASEQERTDDCERAIKIASPYSIKYEVVTEPEEGCTTDVAG